MKTKLASVCLGLALLAGVHQTTGQVTNLGIVPAPGGQSLLYWPASLTNYLLQTTANLESPTWVTASNAVPVNAATVTNFDPAGYFRLLATTNTMAGMVLIPAGSFTMGNYLFFNGITNDPDILDADPTNVNVSAFYMDANLVSYSQWQNVYAYATNRGYSFDHPGAGMGPNHPVGTLEWSDCVKWSNARSEQAGLTPVYYTDAGFTQVFTNGATPTVYQNLAVNGYRLPTEAEWEKAARGGLSDLRFPWGNSISQSQANYYSEPLSDGSESYDLGPIGPNPIGAWGPNGWSAGTSPVGSFAPNGYGLYDMAGNVMQWCWDWYGTPYGQPTTNNPTGPGPTSGCRVLRGGFYSVRASEARCANRRCAVLHFTLGVPPFFGFRCVRGL